MTLLRTLAIAAAVSLASSARAAVFTFTGEVSGPPGIFLANGPAIAAAFPLPSTFDWSVTYQVNDRPDPLGPPWVYQITNLDLDLGPYSFSGPSSGTVFELGPTIVEFRAALDNVTSASFPLGPLQVGADLIFHTNLVKAGVPSPDASSYKLSGGIFSIDHLSDGFYFFETSALVSDTFTLTSASFTGALASIPEPSEWTMLIVGAGLAGSALRQVRRSRRPGQAPT
jgi:hypothetical protein